MGRWVHGPFSADEATLSLRPQVKNDYALQASYSERKLGPFRLRTRTCVYTACCKLKVCSCAQTDERAVDASEMDRSLYLDGVYGSSFERKPRDFMAGIDFAYVSGALFRFFILRFAMWTENE
jgi:hypothetical protein